MNLNASLNRQPFFLVSMRTGVISVLALGLFAANGLAQPTAAPLPAMPIAQAASAPTSGLAQPKADIPAAVRALDGGMVLAQGAHVVKLDDLREAAAEFVSAGEQASFWQSPSVMGEMVGSLYRQQALATKARAAKLTLPSDATALTRVQTNRELGNMYLLQESQRRMPKPDAIERYAKAQYDQAPSRYDHGEMFRVSHILVAVAEGKRTDEQARERAQSVVDRLAKGEDFGALAAEMSDDLSSRNAKGSLGYHEAKELPQDFVAVLQTMETGSRSAAPVKTKAGYHVIWLQEKRPPGRLSFEDLRDHLVGNATAQLKTRSTRAVWDEALAGFELNTANLEQVAAAMRAAK